SPLQRATEGNQNGPAAPDGATAGGALLIGVSPAVGRVPFDAALGQRVLVSAQLIAPVFALERKEQLVVGNCHRIFVLLDDGGASTLLELLFQEFLLLS